MKPMLAYYGGKQRIASKIIPLIPKHTVYVEPFCGGATILFKKPWPNITNNLHYREVINDIDDRLVNLYRQVIENGEVLKIKIDATLYSESDHKRSAYILKNQSEFSDLERAWAYYVNVKQSFANELIRGWGRGVYSDNHASSWSKNSDIKNYITRMKSVHISCQDALKVIKQWDSPQTFFYCDPPYPGTAQHYSNEYTLYEFKCLIDALDNCNGNFILSCYKTDLEIPNDWEKFEFKSYCYASGKGKVNADRTRKSTKKELGDIDRTEIIYRRFNKVPVRTEIQKLYESGKFDCFYGGRQIELFHFQDHKVINE